ncbi:MAG: formyltransferase family protein [Pseudomonadales bacterium]|nr:formyltransferase family protein [Pseudomonadales bacterium]
MSANPPSRRIILCCHASAYGSRVLADLIAGIGSDSVAAVVVSTRIRYERGNALRDILSIVRTSGIRYAFYLLVITTVFNFFAHWRRSSNRYAFPSVARQCEKNRLPLFKTKNINSAQGRQFIQRQVGAQDTILLTAMFNQKLSIRVLSLPQLFCVNLHPGQLPQYRGVDPVLMACCEKQDYLEMTLHQTVAELDEGHVFRSKKIAVDPSASLFAQQMRLFAVGADIFMQWLSDNASQDLRTMLASGKPQIGKPGYHSWPKKNQVAGLDKLISLADLRFFFSR